MFINLKFLGCCSHYTFFISALCTQATTKKKDDLEVFPEDIKKSILILLLLVFSICTNAQKDSLMQQFASRPDSTGFGTPDGKLVSQQIGIAGGKIASEDGRVELIFPAGALTANTTISIQPITNKLNGSGKAYQLEPSGTQFKKPVQLNFKYTDEEAETCPPDLKSFALQDHKGKWTYFEYKEWDSTTKTLSGYIEHFSALVTDQNDVLLVPQYQFIGVSSRSIIFIQHRNNIDTGEFRGEHEFSEFAGNRSGLFVNGFRGGNELVGTITNRGILTGYTPISAGYTAPNILPKQNPVEIKIAFKYYSRIKKKIMWGKSKCNVTIFDKYKITVIHEIKGEDFGNKEFLGGGELIDSGSYVVEIYPGKLEFSDFKNYPPSITKAPGKEMSGTLDLKIFTTGAQGSIHLTSDYTNYRLSRDYPPEVFFLIPPRSINGFSFQYVGSKYTSPVTMLPYPALPPEIEFIANRKRQEYNVTIAGQSSHKLIVTPYYSPSR